MVVTYRIFGQMKQIQLNRIYKYKMVSKAITLSTFSIFIHCKYHVNIVETI